MKKEPNIGRSTFPDNEISSQQQLRVINPNQISIIVDVTDMHSEYFIDSLEDIPIIGIAEVVVVVHRLKVVKKRL